MSYDAYINRKLSRIPPTGIPHGFAMPDHGLFDHQRALVSWACKRGRAAIFADTGLGKSRMQLAWADAVRLHTGLPVLILAPLAVAPQTVEEGASIGVAVQHCRDGSDYDPSEGSGIVALGMIISMALQILVFPAFGHAFTLAQNIGITVIFTVASILRSYVVRRWFNAALHRAAVRVEIAP